MNYVKKLSETNLSEVKLVGGKNASIGEMIQQLSQKKINICDGYAITTKAYQNFIEENKLQTHINTILDDITDHHHLEKASHKIQKKMVSGKFSHALKTEIAAAYAELGSGAVAIRSSAVQEDSKEASFAGMQESYLNVRGLQQVLKAVKLVFASLYSPRAINYRLQQGYEKYATNISVGMQKMIRSDKAVSGVMFTLDMESGFDKVVVISAAYGLGEGIVQGIVNPDEFIVYKPALQKGKQAILERRLGDKKVMVTYGRTTSSRATRTQNVPAIKNKTFCLNDEEVQLLAQQATLIENYYACPMDIEWAKDGVDGQFYILQARPETVIQKHNKRRIERYQLINPPQPLITGQSIGQGIGQGKSRIILDVKKQNELKPGDVLVAEMTDPDWEPIMKIASAIVTDRGGRTCHAAIIARELGIPAIVGCGQATTKIKNNQMITVSCGEGLKGNVYPGKVEYTKEQFTIDKLPNLPIKIMLNIGNPDKAFEYQFLPNDGVGLARIEFIISNMIGIHPNATLEFELLPKKLQQEIRKKMAGYAGAKEFYIQKLAEGMAKIAAAFFPKPIIFRFSDFKTNEYANLIGGDRYEPKEENPMLGFRGASRYYNERFRSSFELECKALKILRQDMGLTNAYVMVPFVRTVAELSQVIDLLATFGLKRGEDDLKIYMMCEIPSNVILAEEFLNFVDGFSIGSNDLTQLCLGLDRDSSVVANLFDERDGAVKALLQTAINVCLKNKKYIGICGQGPSDHADFAQWLVKQGIQSISLNPDTILQTWLRIAKMEIPERTKMVPFERST